MLNIWKSGLPYVFKALDYARISHDIFVVGDGTTLMHFLTHRLSKDIDIFLKDQQHLNFFLPPLNGYLENIASDYSNLANFIMNYLAWVGGASGMWRLLALAKTTKRLSTAKKLRM